MPPYELDDYIQEHVCDNAVNSNCVANWRVCAYAAGRVGSLSIDLHKDWWITSPVGTDLRAGSVSVSKRDAVGTGRIVK